jgi:hypothetical protein
LASQTAEILAYFPTMFYFSLFIFTLIT